MARIEFPDPTPPHPAIVRYVSAMAAEQTRAAMETAESVFEAFFTLYPEFRPHAFDWAVDDRDDFPRQFPPVAGAGRGFRLDLTAEQMDDAEFRRACEFEAAVHPLVEIERESTYRTLSGGDVDSGLWGR
jgi:hypothetical protein